MINRTSNATQHHAGVVRWLYVVIWCDVLNMFKRMIINDVTSDSFHQLLAKCAWRSQFRLQSVQICSLRKATTNKTYKKNQIKRIKMTKNKTNNNKQNKTKTKQKQFNRSADFRFKKFGKKLHLWNSSQLDALLVDVWLIICCALEQQFICILFPAWHYHSMVTMYFGCIFLAKCRIFLGLLSSPFPPPPFMIIIIIMIIFFHSFFPIFVFFEIFFEFFLWLFCR